MPISCIMTLPRPSPTSMITVNIRKFPAAPKKPRSRKQLRLITRSDQQPNNAGSVTPIAAVRKRISPSWKIFTPPAVTACLTVMPISAKQIAAPTSQTGPARKRPPVLISIRPAE